MGRLLTNPIFIIATLVGALGGWLGALMDHGNYLGGWSILFTFIGSMFGIWLGYIIRKNYL